ncbi:thiol-activated cytolysin family protein [Sphingobacterium thalpophilum]|uniref:thiol-activated cytolysin family protein n=1 Tax=Sphingobacterium thalpophilum TaxID=259 RepID=UPI003C772668
MKVIKIDYLSWRGWRGIAVFFVMSFGVSCSTLDLDNDISTSSKYQALDQLSSPIINGFTINSKSNVSIDRNNIMAGSGKRADASTSTLGQGDTPRLRAGIGGINKDGPDSIRQSADEDQSNKTVLYLQRKYKANMFTIADGAMALNIFPGAILDGRSLEGNFSPRMLQGISSGIRPITISTSLPVSGYAVAKTAIAKPTAGIALVNAALADLEKVNPGEIGTASLDVTLDTFRVYEEIKTLYGYQKGLDAFLINTNTTKQGENHLIVSKSAIKIKFFQHNFTVDTDIPKANELFDPTGLNMQTITGGKVPVYVKSVTYGRMGIMVIESEANMRDLFNAVYKQIGIIGNFIGIDRNMTEQDKAIINQASIRVKYTGIGTDTSPAEWINGLGGFIQVLSANKTYSKTSPGIPIAFQLAELNSSNKLVEAPFQINYGPFEKPYVRIEYRNSKWEKDENISNPMFTESDIYMCFYKDPTGQAPYDDAPIFVPYLYQRSYGSKSTYDWNGSWSTSQSVDTLRLKYPTANKFIENKKVFYYVKYGSDSRTSRDYTRFDMRASENYYILPVKYDNSNATRPYLYQMNP